MHSVDSQGSFPPSAGHQQQQQSMGSTTQNVLVRHTVSGGSSNQHHHHLNHHSGMPLPNTTSSNQFLNLQLNHSQTPPQLNAQVFKPIQPRKSIMFFIKVGMCFTVLIFLLNIIVYLFGTSERQEFERDIHSSFDHFENPQQLQHSINKELLESKEKLSLLRKNAIESTSPTALSKIKGVFFGGVKSGNSKSSFPLLSRYNPPKVPSIMESFTSDKRLTTVSNSGEKGTPLVSIAMGPPKSEHGFYIDKEKEIKARIDVSNIPRMTLDMISQMFESKEHCIRNDLDMGVNKKTDTQYTTCKFENICMNRRGNWIMYTNRPLETSERPWVYTSSHYNQDFSSPKFKVKIATPAKSVLFKGSDNFSEKKMHSATITLAPNFKWISTPTFGFFRHSAGEVGSLILDNYLPMFNQMADFEYVNYKNNILFFDDIHNEATGIYARGDKETSELAEDLSIDFSSFVSSNIPLQICNNDERGTFVDFAPCKQSRNAESKPLELEGEELDTCFSSLVVGSPDSYFLEPEKRHHLIPVFRDYVLNGIGYVPPRSYFEGPKKILIIGVLNTMKSKKKGSIVNSEKLTHFLNNMAKDILQQVNSLRIPDDRYDSIRILNLKLEEMSMAQQIRLFTVMDVFITNQGMDAYYSLFMYNPRALVIHAPTCYSETNQCTDYNSRVLHTFSNLKSVSLMDHLSLLECVQEPSDNAKGSPVQAMKEISKQPPAGDSCNIRIDQSGLYLLVIKAIEGKLR